MGIRKGYIAVGSGATSAPQTISPTAETLTASEPAVSITLGLEVSASVATLSLAEPAVDVQMDWTLNLSVATLSLAEPAVDVQMDWTLNLSVATLTLEEPALTLVYDQFPDASVAALTASEPAVGVNPTIGATVETLTLQEPSPGVRLAAAQTLSASVEALALGEPQANLLLETFSIDNDPVTEGALSLSDVVITPKSLILTWRAAIDKVSTLRKYETAAGELRELGNSDGGWQTQDASLNEANTFNVKPPSSLVPPLEPITGLVDDYREASSPTGYGRDVEVSFRRKRPRTASGTILSETAGSHEWTFQFHHGTIATQYAQRVDQGGHGDVRIDLQLTDAQLEVVLVSATHLDAVSVEEIPDGDDFVRDNDPDSRNTVTITRPGNLGTDWLPSEGDYAVREWQVLEGPNPRWRVEMTVRKL